MNFKKLSKEKRNNLILVVLMTAIAVAGLGFGLIKFQYHSLEQIAKKKEAGTRKLKEMRDLVKISDRFDAELADGQKKLGEAETDMASGDLYAWVISTLRRFKAGYKVEMPQFSPIGAVTDMNLLPYFPYKQATLTVAGTAHYHDFGKFLADFENEYPHIRVLNLTLDTNPAPGPEDQETLSFKMDIVTLVKPTQS